MTSITSHQVTSTTVRTLNADKTTHTIATAEVDNNHSDTPPQTEARDENLQRISNQHRLQALENPPQSSSTLKQWVQQAGELRNAHNLEAKTLLMDWHVKLAETFGEEQAMPQNASRSALSNAETDAVNYPLSSWQIANNVAASIAEMNEEYLEVFQYAAERYGEFFSDFSDLMTGLTKFVSAEEDRTILDARGFRRELEALMTKYDTLPPNRNATLYPPQSSTGLGVAQGVANRAEAEAWARQMGLDPDKTVVRLSNNTYVVTIDSNPLDMILASLTEDTMTMNSAQWTAWQTGLDQQKSNIQTSVQTLLQKYSNANSTFDNLVKVLSSTMSSLLETDKSFFNV